MYFVANLDPPSNIWEVVYETSETCDTMIIATVYGILKGMRHLSRGMTAQSLSMKTNTDINKHSEANVRIHSRPHLCDLPVAFRNNAPASSTAGPEATRRD